MKKEKTFVKPIIEIISFHNEDIITYSKGGTAGDDWSQYPGVEGWDD